MGYRETRIGEFTRRRKRAAAVGLAGALALTLAACTSSSGTAPRSHPTTTTAPALPAEGCIGITATSDGPPSPNGIPYTFRLIGRWSDGTKPIGEQLTITPETSAGPGIAEQQPMVPADSDGVLPDTLSYDFPAAEVVAKYAVQGVIILRHGSHRIAPVTPYCAIDITTPSTPYQQAPEGTVTVTNNNGP